MDLRTLEPSVPRGDTYKKRDLGYGVKVTSTGRISPKGGRN